MLHVFVNVAPGVSTVPSGTVTSLRYTELSQLVTPLDALIKLTPDVAVGRLINVAIGIFVDVAAGCGVDVDSTGCAARVIATDVYTVSSETSSAGVAVASAPQALKTSASSRNKENMIFVFIGFYFLQS